MDTNDFINLLQDKVTAEKVLDALEDVRIAVAVHIETVNPSAHDVLKLINLCVYQARQKYKEKTDACIAAAKQAVYESSIEKFCGDRKR